MYNTKANSADNAEKTVENTALAANKWCSRDLNSCLARPLQLLLFMLGKGPRLNLLGERKGQMDGINMSVLEFRSRQ